MSDRDDRWLIGAVTVPLVALLPIALFIHVITTL